MTEAQEQVFAPTDIVVHGNGFVTVGADGKLTGVDKFEFSDGRLSINKGVGGPGGVVMSSTSYGGVGNFMSIGSMTMSGGQINIDGMQISTAKGGTELHVKSSRLKYVVVNGTRLATTSASSASRPERPPPRLRLDLERTSIESITLNHAVVFSIKTTKVMSKEALMVSTNGSTTLNLPRGLRVQSLVANTNGSSDFNGCGVKCSRPVSLSSNGSSDIKGVTALAGGVASANGSSDIKVNSNRTVRKSRGGTASIRVSAIED